jgi:alpha-tubulin suppressor-like RCC1 family protein/pimeloyl-ACP methyl ester carboxylesterase
MPRWKAGFLCTAVFINCGSEGFDRDNPATKSQAQSSSTTTAIATGMQHACSLFQGGKVLCWGRNDSGQVGAGNYLPHYSPVLVGGITTAIAVTAGTLHSCALLSDSTIRCWGNNTYGQLGNGTNVGATPPVTVSGISTATAIAAGGYQTCARLSDSTVKCWGKNASGELGNGSTTNSNVPVAVTGISNATAIAAGASHTCARLSNSTVKCWGTNAQGMLGDGTTTSSTTPVTVSGLTTATEIAAGPWHTCALLGDSTLRCWGLNTYGQLGDGTKTQRTTPAIVSGITTAAGLAVGDNHTCARLTDGSAKCWGLNTSGQLGTGSMVSSETPVAVSGLSNAVQIAGGYDFTCATLTSGGPKCWGGNGSGQLALGTASSQWVPATVLGDTLNKVMDVATGLGHTCVLWDTGSVKCWGKNDSGQLGDGTTTASASPVDVSGITNAVALTASHWDTCALLSTGSVQCWGMASGSTPVTVSGISNATAISGGQQHRCARISDGTVKCWGNNSSGQLGNNTTTSSPTAVTVSGITTAVSVSAGDLHSCASLSDGSAKCWGNNESGQLGNGHTSSTPSLTPVSVLYLSGVSSINGGTAFTCAVLTSGGVKCWGNNYWGQLGSTTNTAEMIDVPVSVSGISTATAVDAGRYNTCAVLANKSLKCWGRNPVGQFGDGTTADSTLAVSTLGITQATHLSGYYEHVCVRNIDSTLSCWGQNANGQLGNGEVGTYTTPTSPACSIVDVERSDYFVSYTTSNMPDSAFNGLSAQLDTHRVKPLYFPESCTADRAAVLVHGRTVEAVSAFDLQYRDYAFMEQLARTGVDTFTFNHLGLGKSRIPTADALTNPCNASLPACLDIGQTCPPPSGVLCDCGPTATFGVNDKDQQGATRYLNPNPLTARCAHTTNTRFTSTTTMVNELDVVVNDALSKTSLSKVSLLGYSAGGIDVGNYLGTADETVRAAHTAKVEKAIFVSSLFGSPQVGENEPAGGSNVHSFPMGVLDRTSATAGGFNIQATCPGQRDSGIITPIWSAMKARDAVASSWGPTQSPTANGGLSRFPHATRWGWTSASAARITVPVLVMHGLFDNVVAVAASANLYGALTGTSSKTVVQIGCASHSIFWEGCSGSSCNGWTGPHFTVFKNARDWIKTGMIYASPGSTNGAFESDSDDGANAHTSGPTSSGPTADESNLLP